MSRRNKTGDFVLPCFVEKERFKGVEVTADGAKQRLETTVETLVNQGQVYLFLFKKKWKKLFGKDKENVRYSSNRI